MASGVYVIQNKVTGKSYIGSTDNSARRWSRHCMDLRAGRHHNVYLQRAWDKWGEKSFIFEFLEVCGSSELLRREQCYLDKLRPDYNLSPIAGAPMAGRTHSVDTIQRMRFAHLGNQSRLGIKHTPETRIRMALSRMGKKRGPYQKRGKYVRSGLYKKTSRLGEVS